MDLVPGSAKAILYQQVVEALRSCRAPWSAARVARRKRDDWTEIRTHEIVGKGGDGPSHGLPDDGEGEESRHLGLSDDPLQLVRLHRTIQTA